MSGTLGQRADRTGRDSSPTARWVDVMTTSSDHIRSWNDPGTGCSGLFGVKRGGMPARHRPVATLATVAAAAGVSRQTVSNALNSPELLRPDTLQRVQQAIDRLGYTPNRAARNLRTRTSHLVGLRLEPAVEGTASGLMDRFL